MKVDVVEVEKLCEDIIALRASLGASLDELIEARKIKDLLKSLLSEEGTDLKFNDYSVGIEIMNILGVGNE